MGRGRRFIAVLGALVFFLTVVFIASDPLTQSWLRSYKSIEDRLGSYNLEPCQCLKHRGRGDRATNESSLSTCSRESSWYGPNQKVLSYSLFMGQKDNYTEFLVGLQKNLDPIRKYYPDWVVRIYTNMTLDREHCQFACLDTIFWCDIRNSSYPGLRKINAKFWRFLPLGDRSVQIFVSRDLDSLVVEREHEVVSEWLKSDRPFHAARDHGMRNTRPIQAGIWGAKNNVLGWARAAGLRNKLMKSGRKRMNAAYFDETMLRTVLFKPYHELFLQHDSYLCKMYPGSKPFPKQRFNRSMKIAEAYWEYENNKNTMNLAKPCPVQCRPSYGKHWIYC